MPALLLWERRKRKRSKSVSAEGELLRPAPACAGGVSNTHALQTVLLGDSITEITCWRPLVWTQLATANLTGSIQLVGSMNGAGSCQKPAGFDGHHEGHSGIQANEVVKKIAGWVQTTKPDVVQFMLGTNDVNIGKKDDKSILEAYNSILASIRAANPKVFIVVSSSTNLAVERNRPFDT